MGALDAFNNRDFADQDGLLAAQGSASRQSARQLARTSF